MTTEQRLIDANVAVDGIIDQLEIEWGYDGIREDVQRIFDSTPTVDAVEVVRCKDCKHRKRPLFAGNGIYCEEQRRHFELDDFCSYGERRTDHV